MVYAEDSQYEHGPVADESSATDEGSLGDMGKVAVVIPTLWSPISLCGVLRSLAAQTLRPVEVVVVAQQEFARAELLVAQSEFPEAKVIRSATGLSRARNQGIMALSSDWDVLALPDDDVEYTPPSLENAWRVLSGAEVDAVSGRVLPMNSTADARLRFGTESTRLDEYSVWTSSMEAAYILSRNFVEEVGVFDENLGLGARTPWRSGEGTELLLRGIRAGKSVMYEPAITLLEWAPQPAVSADKLRRIRSYARGTGMVYRLHYGITGRARLLLRSVARLIVGFRTLSFNVFRENVALLIGRCEGLLGRTLRP
jgi:glycosyltransferase involved in cell wall biosynthesis